jgi:hypothetical protein
MSDEPKWTDGCDFSWHDPCIAILVPIFDGKQYVSACLQCLSELLEEGKSKAEIIAELEQVGRDYPNRLEGVNDGQDAAVEKA